jgi:hypothetical protein
MRLLATFLLLASAAASAAPLALRDGEALTYKVGWGLFPHAGEIKIAAENAITADSPLRLRVTTTTETKGLARALYEFEARAEAMLDAKTGRLLTNAETSKSPSKETKNAVTFDYAKSTAAYTNAVNSTKDATLTVPAGDPLDLIMSLVQTRMWDLKPGEKRDALVLFDDEFYELTIYADRYEDVRTPLGKFKTLVLVPRMEKTPPKGMFKKGSVVSVWISQDEQKLPVKFQVDFKFGAGVALLIRYTPPGTAPADGTPDAATKPAVAGPESNAQNPRS